MVNSPDQIAGAFPGIDILRGQITEEESGKLKAPENIVKTLWGARSIFFKYRKEHLPRVLLYAAIEGLLAGNPPYDPAELAKHALGHVANFNDMKGRSYYEKGAQALWNLINEVEYIAEFSIRYDGAKNDEPVLEEFGDIIAEHYDDIVRGWESFKTIQNTNAAQFIKFGISPVFRPDPHDWKYRTVEVSKFYVGDQALCDMERLSAICVESIFDVQYLFGAYRQAWKDTFGGANPKKSPWNLNELKHLLLRQANSYYKAQGFPYDEMDAQRKLQNGDLMWESAFTDNIKLVSLFYKEYDGKISHYMFHQFIGQQDCLFFQDRVYDRMSDALTLFTASPGEFTIHSNRGLGHKIFALAQATNQLNCSLVDAGRWAATVLLKSTPILGSDSAPIRFMPGGVSHIGTSEVVETNVGENVNQLIGLSNFFDGMSQRNILNSGDDPTQVDADKGSISGTQARMMSFREFGVLRNVIEQYYGGQDNLHKGTVNIWLKALADKRVSWACYKDAKRWRDRCIADGVPAEVFEWNKEDNEPRHLKVHASRVAGDGSTLARIMGLEAVQQIVGALDQDGVYEWQRQWIMATMGKAHLRAFLPSRRKQALNTGGDSIAGAENGLMLMGRSPVLGGADNHIAHISTHLAVAKQVLFSRAQEQMSAMDADKVLVILAPHLQEHFQRAAQNPFNESRVDALKPIVAEVVKQTTLNHANAVREYQAQQRQQAADMEATEQTLNDEQRKDISLQGEERRKDEKVRGQNARADEANRTRADILRRKAQSDADTARLKVQLDASAKTPLNEAGPGAISPYDIPKPETLPVMLGNIEKAI